MENGLLTTKATFITNPKDAHVKIHCILSNTENDARLQTLNLNTRMSCPIDHLKV